MPAPTHLARARRLALALSGLAALASAPSAQQTYTVDDDGPADFTSVADAVVAASDGDTILVKPGTYQLQVAIDGKGLTLQADGRATLTIFLAQAPTLTVKNVPAGHSVLVRGFDVTAVANFETTTVQVENCAGPVVFEDCYVNGGGTPMSVKSCASVTLSRCDLIAPPTFANYTAFMFFGFAPYLGLAVIDSNAFLYGCDVRGSDGYDAGNLVIVTIPPAPGAPAMRVGGSTVLASGCSFAGGDGGGGTATLCYPGEDGEPGIVVDGGFVDPSGTARLLGCAVTGGAAGTGTCGNPDGVAGTPLDVVAGTVETLPGGARAFFGDSPTVEGGAVGVHLTGEPGDAVILHVQLDAAPGLYLADYALAFHLPLPTAVVGLGAIPPGGQLDLSIPTPPLAPGVDSFRLVGQALFVGASGFFEGGPSTLLLIDSAL